MDFTEIRALTRELLETEIGLTVTLWHRKGVGGTAVVDYNPITDEQTVGGSPVPADTPQDMPAVLAPIGADTVRRVAAANFSGDFLMMSESHEVTLPAEGALVPPRPGDEIEIPKGSGKRYEVVNVTPVAPNGTVILWRAVVRLGAQ